MQIVILYFEKFIKNLQNIIIWHDFHKRQILIHKLLELWMFLLEFHIKFNLDACEYIISMTWYYVKLLSCCEAYSSMQCASWLSYSDVALLSC